MYFLLCLESSVLSVYFLSEKDNLCCVNRCLKVPSVNPMQYFSVGCSFVVISALYMMFVVRQLLSIGHWSFFRQLHICSGRLGCYIDISLLFVWIDFLLFSSAICNI